MKLLDNTGKPILKDRFRMPLKYRIDAPKGSPLENVPPVDGCGYFAFNLDKSGTQVCCIASNGMGWDHVSVQVIEKRIPKIPSWDVMQLVKEIFWERDAMVVQYHPPGDDYVDTNPTVLHLWRCQQYEYPAPPYFLVGPDRGRPEREFGDIFDEPAKTK